jgi:2-polyprenyl-3-methyl-5-hydroxy-6-metoxy-1,4-benzoquinol methylase
MGNPRACPICGIENVRPFCTKQQANYYICRKCQTIFQHPLPPSASMAAWADSEYVSGAYHDYVAARPMKKQHFEDRLAQIGDQIGSGRLLDVGCSCGYFIEVAAARGFDVQGVEFSRSAIAAASSEVRSRIFQGVLEDLPHIGTFDVVTAFDLIEHLQDPREFLRRSARLLKPGGTLVLSTPDTGHVLRRIMRSRWPMLQPMQHLHLFSRKSLVAALQSEGFVNIRAEIAYKTLSADYLLRQIRTLNPVLSCVLGAVRVVTPASVLRKYRRINIGEILAIASRP